MQVFDYIELYITAVFVIAAIAVVAESIVLPLMDMLRKLTPVKASRTFASVHELPKPTVRKSYKDWDTMQLDAAA